MPVRKPNVDLVCNFCKKCFSVRFKLRNRKYCSVKCGQEKNKGSGNPAYGKVYRTKATHPKWANSISEGLIRNEVNVGDKNGMKNPEVAARMSKTRREKVTSNPAYRAARAKFQREAWAAGKFDGVPVGKCKWYPHTKPDGSVVKLQGTWEVAFARWMDTNRIDYKAHRGRIPFIGSDGTEHSYYPDFYIPQSRMYVDVKGAFWDSEQAEKIDLIRKSNPKLNLFIANKEIFKEFRINYSTVQDELL